MLPVLVEKVVQEKMEVASALRVNQFKVIEEKIEKSVQKELDHTEKFKFQEKDVEEKAPVAASKASVEDEFREVEVDLETGMLVGIHGLQSAPALNGTVSVVHGYDGASHRYMVETESGTIKKFKRCNLVLEQEIEGDVEEECDESADGGDGDDRLCGSGIGCLNS